MPLESANPVQPQRQVAAIKGEKLESTEVQTVREVTTIYVMICNRQFTAVSRKEQAVSQRTPELQPAPVKRATHGGRHVFRVWTRELIHSLGQRYGSPADSGTEICPSHMQSSQHVRATTMVDPSQKWLPTATGPTATLSTS